MLLQELFKIENKQLKQIYSIQINDDSTKNEYATPPDELEEIGFILDIDESDGTMSERLMDVIINYRLTNMSVIVEVPSNLIYQKITSIKYLLQIANNIDFSIALLPPGHQHVSDDFSIEAYKEVILETVRELLLKQNFDKVVFPISNYFEYLMLEVILGTEKLQKFYTKDKFIEESFIAKMSIEQTDDFKNSIREELYQHYGGKDEFNNMSKVMIATILKRASDSYQEFVKPMVNKNIQDKMSYLLSKN